MKLRAFLKEFRPKPREGEAIPLGGEGKHSVDNVDALASTSTGGSPATFPPNYVPPEDEGRLRH
jgi:hypothetical protein